MTKFLQKRGAKLWRWLIILLHAPRQAGRELRWQWRGAWRVRVWAFRHTNWLLGPWRLARRYHNEQQYLTGWLLDLQDEVYDSMRRHDQDDHWAELDKLAFEVLAIEARIEVLENGAHETVDQLMIEEGRVGHLNGGLALHLN